MTFSDPCVHSLYELTIGLLVIELVCAKVEWTEDSALVVGVVVRLVHHLPLCDFSHIAFGLYSHLVGGF